jgi:hypothetical protein
MIEDRVKQPILSPLDWDGPMFSKRAAKRV